MLCKDVVILVHLDHDSRNILIHRILEVMRYSFGLNCIVPVKSLPRLTVVKSGSVHGGIDAIINHFDADNWYMKKDSVFSNLKERHFPDSTVEPFDVKRFSIAPVEVFNSAF